MHMSGIYQYMQVYTPPFHILVFQIVMVTSNKARSLKKIKRNSSQALFSQLEEIIRDGIENGLWDPGEAIPSERELSNMYGLSRMTVRRALDRLVSNGLLFRVDGKGTFVNEPKVSYQALSLAGLREQTIGIGQSPSAKLLGVEKILAPMNIASVLNIKPDEPLYLIERVSFANEMPFALHRSYIPEKICPGLLDSDLANNSLYALLKKYKNITISRASETLESALATDRESLFLNVPAGSPMFLLRITTFEANDKPIEFAKVIFRGDRIQLSLNI